MLPVYAYQKKRAGAEWDPASVGTVLADLDARFVTTSGGTVTAMVDQSGNGFDATAPTGEEPTYQASRVDYANNPAVYFPNDGTKHLDMGDGIAALIGTNPFTLFLVGHIDDQNTPSNSYFVMTKSGGVCGIFGAIGDTGWKHYVTADFGTSKTATVPTILCATFNGTSSKFYANGKTAVAISSQGAHNVAAGFRLGQYQVVADVFAACGPILRAIFYAGAMAQGDVEAALDGLGALYGITISP